MSAVADQLQYGDGRVVRLNRTTKMKTLLVPVGGSDADAAVLQTALTVAQPLGAHLELVHVRVDVVDAAVHTPHMGFARGAGLSKALDRLASRAATRVAAAERNARAFCARNGIALVEGRSTAEAPPSTVTARWLGDEGEAIERLLLHAHQCDLIVMARPTDLDGLPPDRLERLLLGSGRPMLIAPVGVAMRALDTVLICWRPTPDAAAAVAAAMPLLAKARRVVVVSVSEHGEDPAPSLGELAARLAQQNITAETHALQRMGRSTADTLLAATKTYGADLMVMGAYGHRRLRELLFGGCTQSALAAAHCAVLLVH
jgi:nucleotide-binding universal stress UspA family protein